MNSKYTYIDGIRCFQGGMAIDYLPEWLYYFAYGRAMNENPYCSISLSAITVVIVLKSLAVHDVQNHFLSSLAIFQGKVFVLLFFLFLSLFVVF